MEIQSRDRFCGLDLWGFCATSVGLEIFSSPVFQKNNIVVLAFTVSS